LAASDFHHPALIGSLVAGRAVDHRRSRSEVRDCISQGEVINLAVLIQCGIWTDGGLAAGSHALKGCNDNTGLRPIALCHLPQERPLLASWIPSRPANLRQFLSDELDFLLAYAALFLVVLRVCPSSCIVRSPWNR
jgi:hypothetical protein